MAVLQHDVSTALKESYAPPYVPHMNPHSAVCWISPLMYAVYARSRRLARKSKLITLHTRPTLPITNPLRMLIPVSGKHLPNYVRLLISSSL